jgi:DNA-binding NarL/FixJ family response regulator
MDQPLRVVIADDHPIFRGGLRQVLEAARGILLDGEADDGEAALELIRSRAPDVAVLDIDMPRRDALGVLRALREEGSASAVVVLTMHRDEALLNEALTLGALGYVLKDSAVTEIVRAVHSAASRELFVSPQLAPQLVRRRERHAALREAKPGLGELTPAERRVLGLVADGKTNREIAEKLFLSVRTVENHRAAIAGKLELSGPNALLKFARAHRAELAS